MSEHFIPNVPQNLGGYRIESEIRRGGTSIVYRAYQPKLDRRVAIKVLFADEHEDSELFLENFRREAKAIANLRHPNILTAHDYGEVDDLAYLVMEYVAGGTLKDQLTGGPVSWAKIASLIIPVGMALAYAHSQGIVHRDVKPANILLPRPNWPLLADFGLQKIRYGKDDMEQKGIWNGTPAYAAPEQIAGGYVGQRSDIYSLGLVIYELLTGRLPFEGNSLIELLMQRLTTAPVPPSQFNLAIHPKLDTVVLKMLANRPDSRYPSMNAVMHDLTNMRDEDETITEIMPLMPASLPSGGTNVLTTTNLASTRDPYLLVAGTGSIIPLKGKTIVLGRYDQRTPRQPDVDLNPHGGASAGVSRIHARIRWAAEGWVVEDLDSTNGTYLNKIRVQPGQPYIINDGDRVRCGRLVMVFNLGEEIHPDDTSQTSPLFDDDSSDGWQSL